MFPFIFQHNKISYMLRLDTFITELKASFENYLYKGGKTKLFITITYYGLKCSRLYKDLACMTI